MPQQDLVVAKIADETTTVAPALLNRPSAWTPMDEPANADAALRRVGAHGLPGCDAEPIAVESLEVLLVAADAQRVLPQLYAAVRAEKLLNTSDSWIEKLRDHTVSSAETTMAAHAAAIHLARRLDAIGVRNAVILKGCGTAHLDYARPTDRFSSDVDVLVPGKVVGEVVRTFKQLDRVSERSARWNRRYGHAITLMGFNGVDLDVHARMAPAYVGLSIPPDELRENTVPFRIGDASMRVLDGPNRLIHAAVHARSVNIGLHSKRDVPQLVLVSEVDWEEAIRRAERWQVDHFFALGVISAWSAFELPSHPLLEWAERYGRPAGRRQRVAARLAGTRRRGNVMAAPLALPVREWPGYIGPLLFPSKEYVQTNDKDWRARLSIFTDEIRNR